MGTLTLIQEQITSIKAMNSLFLHGFFVLFASLELSWGHFSATTPAPKFCKPGFILLEGNVVGRGYKNWNDYSHDECAKACCFDEKCLSFEFSEKERRCNLNKEHVPTDSRGNFGDYVFCKKNLAPPFCHFIIISQ